PAMSVARTADRLVFSAYESGHYDLYAVEQPSALAARGTGTLPPHADRLPPVVRSESAEPTAERSVARTDTVTFRRARYRPGLSLDYVSQPSVGLAAGSSGLAVGGGLSLYWSDMLGNHSLATLVQFNNAGGSFVNNLSTGVGYTNQHSRWTWGGEASQISYFSGGIVDSITADGTLEETFRSWELDRTAELDLSYPFSRFQRVEFSGGLRAIVF